MNNMNSVMREKEPTSLPTISNGKECLAWENRADRVAQEQKEKQQNVKSKVKSVAETAQTQAGFKHRPIHATFVDS